VRGVTALVSDPFRAPAGPRAPAAVPFGSAPPPSVPLTFFAFAAVGLAAFGMVLILGASSVAAAPRGSAALSIAHLGLLVSATVAVAGALHQFAPVVGARPLRSARVAYATAAMLWTGAMVLGGGFAHGPEMLVPLGGALAFTAVAATAWNVSRPLSGRSKGVPVAGLRISVAYLVVTASFGIVYAFDRTHGWFPLLSQRVLAHAHLGLLGWLGITYVSVAEKLWPMFLLAHRPRARSGAVAVGGLAAGVAALATGLLTETRAVVLAGAAAVVVGLGAHAVSLVSVIARRRRRLELLHAFVLASAGSMITAVVLAAIAGFGEVTTETRERLVAAEVAALFGWIALAVLGHLHKIVPFVTWRMLRARGVERRPNGKPLLFADLYAPRIARGSWVVAVTAVAALVIGLATASPGLLVLSGGAFAAVAVLVTANLTITPRRVAAHSISGGNR
jgi:hypothetical protein